MYRLNYTTRFSEKTNPAVSVVVVLSGFVQTQSLDGIPFQLPFWWALVGLCTTSIAERNLRNLQLGT